MVRKKAETREDLNSLKEEMIHRFHLFSVGLVDQIKQVAEGSLMSTRNLTVSGER